MQGDNLTLHCDVTGYAKAGVQAYQISCRRQSGLILPIRMLALFVLFRFGVVRQSSLNVMLGIWLTSEKQDVCLQGSMQFKGT
jgi:hypothetical protein